MDRNSFKELGINENIIEGLKKQGILYPTQIQKELLPIFLEKKDILAKSQTGSGKTLAYVLPIFMQIDCSVRSTQAIIIAPTHELAAQIHKQILLLSANSNLSIKSALIIGSANITRQIEKLREKPQIVVGSSGRILDLIKRKKIAAHTVKTIVIDEADRMLDDLNLEGVRAVIKTTLKERQIVLLSASISEQTYEIAKTFMKEPVWLEIQSKEKLPNAIKHYYILGEKREKTLLLRKIIHAEKPERAIIFLNNTENIEVIVEKLNYHGLKAAGLYGQAYKSERKNALEDFRSGRVSILISSDIAARGIDIPNLTHVINLDIPEEPIYYLHRAGRTGRNEKEGIVISIVTEYEKKWLNKYSKAFEISFIQKELSYGELIDKRRSNKEYKNSYKKEKNRERFVKRQSIKTK